MAVTYNHAMQFHGRPVIAHLRDGRRFCGMLRHVDGEGIHLEPYQGARPVYTNENEPQIINADQEVDVQIDPVLWGGWFFPFFALAALSPFFWW